MKPGDVIRTKLYGTLIYQNLEFFKSIAYLTFLMPGHIESFVYIPVNDMDMYL